MKIHEYQGKEIFRSYGIKVPKGRPALSPAEAEQAAEELGRETGSETVVVKAQIHAGGRGKAGGVKVVKGAKAAREVAAGLLGKKLVTLQTGKEGQTVKRLLVEQGLRWEVVRRPDHLSGVCQALVVCLVHVPREAQIEVCISASE